MRQIKFALTHILVKRNSASIVKRKNTREVFQPVLRGFTAKLNNSNLSEGKSQLIDNEAYNNTLELLVSISALKIGAWVYPF
jgi:hypothetical protein